MVLITFCAWNERFASDFVFILRGCRRVWTQKYDKFIGPNEKKKTNAGALFRPSKDPTTVIRAIKIREEKEIPALYERQKKVTATR